MGMSCFLVLCLTFSVAVTPGGSYSSSARRIISHLGLVTALGLKRIIMSKSGRVPERTRSRSKRCSSVNCSTLFTRVTPTFVGVSALRRAAAAALVLVVGVEVEAIVSPSRHTLVSRECYFCF